MALVGHYVVSRAECRRYPHLSQDKLIYVANEVCKTVPLNDGGAQGVRFALLACLLQR